MKTITKRQNEIYRFLIDYNNQNGENPTFTDIADEFGFKSLRAVSKHLDALKKKGYLYKTIGIKGYKLANKAIQKKYIIYGYINYDSFKKEVMAYNSIEATNTFLTGIESPELYYRLDINCHEIL